MCTLRTAQRLLNELRRLSNVYHLPKATAIPASRAGILRCRQYVHRGSGQHHSKSIHHSDGTNKLILDHILPNAPAVSTIVTLLAGISSSSIHKLQMVQNHLPPVSSPTLAHITTLLLFSNISIGFL
ncbi:hypothetical protein AOLI_G00297580 [Acnodon oligacanthus]